MDGKKVVEEIKAWIEDWDKHNGPVKKGTTIKIGTHTSLWRKIRTDFRRILWSIVDEYGKFPKEKCRVSELRFNLGGRSIKVFTYIGTFSVLLSDIEDEGVKARNRRNKKQLKELEQKEEKLLIELGKVAIEIEEIKKRIL